MSSSVLDAIAAFAPMSEEELLEHGFFMLRSELVYGLSVASCFAVSEEISSSDEDAEDLIERLEELFVAAFPVTDV